MTCGFGTCPWGMEWPPTLDKDSAARSWRGEAAMSWGCLTPRWGDQAPHPPFLSPQGSRGPKGYKVRCPRGTVGEDTALWGCSLTFV